MAPAFHFRLVPILRVAIEILLGELPRCRALPGELLANEGVSGHALLKRDLGRSATVPAELFSDQVNRIAALAMKRGKSVDFTGYWQRHLSD
jgi:hypothetical protein